jgi:hypothetical protein
MHANTNFDLESKLFHFIVKKPIEIIRFRSLISLNKILKNDKISPKSI